MKKYLLSAEHSGEDIALILAEAVEYIQVPPHAKMFFLFFIAVIQPVLKLLWYFFSQPAEQGWFTNQDNGPCVF